MPVRLNTIPDAESYPAPPARIKWLSALLLMLSVGVAITSLFASDELAKNGPHFWGLACGVPAFIWSLVASVRWLFFITQYIRADAWNKRREEVILQETRRGRRALQILSFSVQTALNGDSVAETTTAFLARQQVLNTYADLRGEDTVRRSVIPVLTNKPVTGRLSEIISRLFIDIRPQLFLLPPDFHINVLLEIDAPLSGASVRTIWQDEWQKAGLPEARLFSAPEPGLAAVDDWLDNFIQEKAVLLVISVRLEPKNPERTAESATALLLANRLTQTALTPQALLHRPECITDAEMMTSGIAQALDWMPVQPDAISGMWTAELDREQRTALLFLNQSFTQEALMYELDAFLGRSGPAAPWLSVAAAALADMTGDTLTESLFSTEQTVPGMFTRQAWEGQVREAIEQVVTARREEIDWVLSDRQQDTSADISPDTLRNRLTSRYFTDFAGSWLAFLNSIRWKKEDSLSGILDQLTLMADARQSPLIALTDTLAWQAAAVRENRGLSDSLAKSAQELFNGKEKTPQQSREVDVPVGPLDKTFAPLLRLLGDKAGGGGGDTQLSLQTYLTRVTRVRLKLQQVTNAPDPQEMTQQLAQTVLQGKIVDLTDTRDYGRLIAASLGEEWSGFGQALFVRPVEQSWRQVLTPAADSLNRQWQRAIVSHWNQDFAGRYPFKASQNDASLPLLAQYLRDDGRINQFIAANLSGVLKREGRYWVADAMNTQGLTVNPDFIRALNRLRDVADTAFASGDAGIHFELRAKPARDVMKTHLVIDGQELEYFNQKERWQRFNWPDEQWQPGASLSWTSTQAMERILADYRGSWSLIRLLEQAQVTPVDSSTFKVVWKAQDGLPLNYLLRVEQGKGPLALLELKNFRLPGQVFLTGRSMKDAEEYGEDADE